MNHNLKITTISAAIAAMVMISAGVRAQTSPPADVMDRIRGQMASIQQLSGRLAEIRDEAGQLREQLGQLAQQYTSELLQYGKENGIEQFAQAVSHPRMAFDLRLIARLRLYDRLVAQRMEKLAQGRDELDYAHQQADDELRIARAVNRQQLYELAARLENTLAQHIELLQSSEQIQSEEKYFDPSTDIWQTVTGQPEPAPHDKSAKP